MKRDDRGQAATVIAGIVATIAIAGLVLTALVASKPKRDTKALQGNALTLPLIFVDGLAKDGPIRQCQNQVLAAAELTGGEGYWRYARIPEPEESTGDEERDRVMLNEWKGAMRGYIKTLRPQLDACDPALRAIEKTLVLTVNGPGSPGCLGLIENVIFVKGELAKPTFIYNYAGSSRRFSGFTTAEGAFEFDLTQSRAIGPDQPTQEFTGQLRGVLSRDGGVVAIDDGHFNGVINDERGPCTFDFTAKERGR